MAMTPHGFLGIEDEVVAAIAEWISGPLSGEGAAMPGRAAAFTPS